MRIRSKKLSALFQTLETRRLLAVNTAIDNGGFENAFTQNYVYTPAGAWTFTGNGGVQRNSSAFNAASAPEGSQTAFLQGRAGVNGSMSQRVNFGSGGTFAISFRAAQRAGNGAQPIKLLVDGVQVGSTIAPTSTAFAAYTTASFTVNAGQHLIALSATDASGDKTTFVDAVSVAPTIDNASFETPYTYLYDSNPRGSAWNFNALSGVQRNNLLFGAAPAPLGSQTAFIRGLNGSAGVMAQTLNFPSAGTYAIGFKAAQRSGNAAQPLKFTVDGVQYGAYTVPASTAFGNYSTAPFAVGAGNHTIAFAATNTYGDTTTLVDAMTITPQILRSSSYASAPIALPGLVEAERYDQGGEGVAYHDLEAANNGGQFRNDGVDVEGTTDVGGGYGLGWVVAGEWLKYSVNVATSGAYTLGVRVASAVSGGTFHVESDGVPITGFLSVPYTGNWQSWTTVTAPVTLSSGAHVLRLVMDAAQNYWVGNFNWMNVTSTVVAVPPTAPTSLVAAVQPDKSVRLNWTDTASNETGFEVQVATNAAFTSGLVTFPTGANATTFTASGLTAGIAYYFRVRALNGTLASAYTGTASATIPSAEAARNLLFFGNSFTLVNDLTAGIAEIVVADHHLRPYVVVEASDSRSLGDALAEIAAHPENNVAKLPAGQTWSNVVMQEFSTGATDKFGDPVQFKADTKSIYNAVRAASPAVRPVLYETWSYLGTDTNLYGTAAGQYANPTAMQFDIRKNYNAAVAEINGLYPDANAGVATAGDNWETLGFPANLYGGYDTKHPGPRGSLIAALTLYKTIYSENVSDIPWSAVSAFYGVRSVSQADWQQMTALVDGLNSPAAIQSMPTIGSPTPAPLAVAQSTTTKHTGSVAASVLS